MPVKPLDNDVDKDESNGSSEPSVVPVETSTGSSSATAEPSSSATTAVSDVGNVPSEDKISAVHEVVAVVEATATEIPVVTEETEKAKHVDEQVHSDITIISTVIPITSEAVIEKSGEKMIHSDQKLDVTAKAPVPVPVPVPVPAIVSTGLGGVEKVPVPAIVSTGPGGVEEVPVPAIVSTGPGGVEKVSSSSSEVAGLRKCHVRIDNFQRPLTDKLLFEWLATTLGYELSKEHLWMNKIKTHCYIDFDSLASAEACIAAVTGQKVNSKHTQHLVAALTEVSAADAETSIEGNMKPSEWKNCQSSAQKVNTSSPSANSTPKVQGPGYQTKTEQGFSVSNDALQSPSTFTITNNKAAFVHQLENSESIRGNTQIGFSTKRNSTAAGLTEESSKRQNTGTTSISTSSLREMREKEKEREQQIAPNNQQNNFGDTVELDTLFRKTKSLPPLYWLPVSAEIVSKRKLLQVQS
jgi:RNSP1-SAP18 binding (RSB) motif